VKVRIPMKMPSLNEYVNANRYNRYAGAKMKKDVQDMIKPYLIKLPKFEKVKIKFVWCEGNQRRDFDNICFAKKFILDSLVELGKLENDNRKNVCGFTDEFIFEKNIWFVEMEMENAD